MIIVTTEQIIHREIGETLGLVRGNTIRAKHVGRDIMASFKSIVGGEIKSYTMALSEAREEALSRMEEEAIKLGADAIIGVKFTTSQVMVGAAEILAYGTAVKFK